MTHADIDVLVVAAGSDPVELDILADLCEQDGDDVRATELRWRAVLAHCRRGWWCRFSLAEIPVYVSAGWYRQGLPEIVIRCNNGRTDFRYRARGWTCRSRWLGPPSPFSPSRPPDCAPAVLAALRAKLAEAADVR